MPADWVLIHRDAPVQVIGSEGFSWINEGKTEQLPKWGYVATQPGAWMRMRLNTNCTNGDKKAEVSGKR